MSFIRKFDRLVHSSRLVGTNRLILRSNLRTQLPAQVDPTIDHIYSLPTLLQHLKQLQRFDSEVQSGWKSKHIKHQLSYVQQHVHRCTHAAISYAQSGSNLTAQAIADLYSAKEQLGVDNKWLETYVAPQVADKIKYFSNNNIYTLLQGLRGQNNPLSETLLKQLNSREQGSWEYVEHDVHSTHVYNYSDTTNCGGNPVLEGLRGNHNFFKFNYNVVTNYFKDWINALVYKKNSVQCRLENSQPVTREAMKNLVSEYKDSAEARNFLSKL